MGLFLIMYHIVVLCWTG